MTDTRIDPPHDLADQRHLPRAERAPREARRRYGQRRASPFPTTPYQTVMIGRAVHPDVMKPERRATDEAVGLVVNARVVSP